MPRLPLLTRESELHAPIISAAYGQSTGTVLLQSSWPQCVPFSPGRELRRRLLASSLARYRRTCEHSYSKAQRVGDTTEMIICVTVSHVFEARRRTFYAFATARRLCVERRGKEHLMSTSLVLRLPSLHGTAAPGSTEVNLLPLRPSDEKHCMCRGSKTRQESAHAPKHVGCSPEMRKSLQP